MMFLQRLELIPKNPSRSISNCRHSHDRYRNHLLQPGIDSKLSKSVRLYRQRTSFQAWCILGHSRSPILVGQSSRRRVLEWNAFSIFKSISVTQSTHHQYCNHLRRHCMAKLWYKHLLLSSQVFLVQASLDCNRCHYLHVRHVIRKHQEPHTNYDAFGSISRLLYSRCHCYNQLHRHRTNLWYCNHSFLYRRLGTVW